MARRNHRGQSDFHRNAGTHGKGPRKGRRIDDRLYLHRVGARLAELSKDRRGLSEETVKDMRTCLTQLFPEGPKSVSFKAPEGFMKGTSNDEVRSLIDEVKSLNRRIHEEKNEWRESHKKSFGFRLSPEEIVAANQGMFTIVGTAEYLGKFKRTLLSAERVVENKEHQWLVDGRLYLNWANATLANVERQPTALELYEVLTRGKTLRNKLFQLKGGALKRKNSK